MAIKTHQLIELERLGVFRRGAKGEWFINMDDGIDISEYLFKAGMFEH